MSPHPVLAADPLTQLIIGILVLAAVVVVVLRLIQRGPTRMGGAMLLIVGALVCVTVLSYLVQTL